MGQLELVLLGLGGCYIGCRRGWVRWVVVDRGCVGGVLGCLLGLSGPGLGSSLAWYGANFGCCCCRLEGGAARNTSGTCSVSLSSRSASCR